MKVLSVICFFFSSVKGILEKEEEMISLITSTYAPWLAVPV